MDHCADGLHGNEQKEKRPPYRQRIFEQTGAGLSEGQQKRRRHYRDSGIGGSIFEENAKSKQEQADDAGRLHPSDPMEMRGRGVECTHCREGSHDTKWTPGVEARGVRMTLPG